MRLPNAPLVEVVFEMRWALQGSEQSPPPFRVDPGFEILAHGFSETAQSQGFLVRKEMVPDEVGALGHSIKYRFFRSNNEPFPLLQIGPGIFACNQATDYEWSEFKSLASSGLKALFSNYPKTKAFELVPTSLEIRYIDAFNKELLGHQDLFQFLGNDTALQLVPSSFLKSNLFVGETLGHVRITRTLKGDKENAFQVEIGTGQSAEGPSLVVISKVVKRAKAIDLGGTNKMKISKLLKWLENAHEITSPFFRSFVSDKLMKNFES